MISFNSSRWWNGHCCGLFIICSAIVSSASGCRLSQPTAIKVKSADHLNVDPLGQSLPVVLKMYQLSSDIAFNQSSFEELWKKDKETLGAELLESYESVIVPGQSVQFSIPAHEKGHFIGAIALFREPIYPRWRFLKKTTRCWFPSPIHLKLHDNHLSAGP